MKKKLVALLIFVIIEIVMLVISISMKPFVRTIIIVVVLSLPIVIPLGYILILLDPLGMESIPDRSVDIHKPLTQDRNAFLKAQPFFCDEYKRFTDTIREYCEYCGTKNSLRKATKRDFNQFIKT